MSDLKQFEVKHKESLFQTLINHLSVWLDDMIRTMGFEKKTDFQWKNSSPNHISLDLDKYENKVISHKK